MFFFIFRNSGFLFLFLGVGFSFIMFLFWEFLLNSIGVIGLVGLVLFLRIGFGFLGLFML